MLKLFRFKIYLALLSIIGMVTVGIFGFKVFAHHSWIDAVYMTIITISTVGYGEVQPLNDSGKIFAVFLIITSVITLGYAITIITEYILSRSNYELLKQKKVQKKELLLEKKRSASLNVFTHAKRKKMRGLLYSGSKL